jgi:hypothetical protein
MPQLLVFQIDSLLLAVGVELGTVQVLVVQAVVLLLEKVQATLARVASLETVLDSVQLRRTEMLSVLVGLAAEQMLAAAAVVISVVMGLVKIRSNGDTARLAIQVAAAVQAGLNRQLVLFLTLRVSNLAMVHSLSMRHRPDLLMPHAILRSMAIKPSTF